MKRILLTAITLVFTSISINAFDGDVTQGTLLATGKDGALGEVTLKRTDVRADISGFIARVNVRQEFVNNFGEPIEAVYVFPLSHDGAVDRMTMTIGSRTIKGVIMRREEARKAYETAKQAGQTAALLDQERPNIFTQSVANILPGETILIDISYVETLKYEGGTYEFVFPMVVGPRYNPGNPTGVRSGGGTSPDTDQVSDASKITPTISKSRTGQDVSVEVNLEAGVPIQNIVSELHNIETQNLSASRAAVKLRNGTTIPNKDFILRYDVTGLKIEDAVLVHRDGRGGFFSMIIQPPDDMTVADLTPKEIVFVLDTSGSMGGFPIEKAKEAMLLSLDGLHPRDTFNIITFAGYTRVLFEEPVPATRGHLETAKAFLKSRSGGGGTEMMKAIRAALEPSGSQEHLRIVCFMTDGYVGNDMAIIEEIQKHKNARVFSFGIGNSVNRYLLENMAKEGNGEAEIITLESESKDAAERFYKRVRTPVLTDLSIDWNGMPVDDVYPSKLTDLFTSKPVVVNGRFTDSRSGSIKLKGKIAGQFYEREINVDFPKQEARHDVLATLWARRKVAELMSSDLSGIQNRNGDKEIEEQITNIGLEFGILTQFTSFVAIEEQAVNPDGNPLKVDVPVENPDGHQLESPVIRLNQTQYYDPTNSTVTVKEKGKQQISVNGGVSGVTTNMVTSNGGGGGGGGTGSGSGSGSGAGRGTGNGPGPITATVNVSTDSSLTVDQSSTKINTNVSKNNVDALPAGTSFSSVLKIAPNKTSVALSAGFQVDGTSGAGNAFFVDGQEVANFRTGTLNVDVGDFDDDITTSIAELKKPLIPQKAKWTDEDSIVKVDFSVDESGKVVTAKAMTGNENLKKPSEQAAMGSKFTAPIVEGDKMRMNGRISYKFVDRKNVEITLESMAVELTPAKKRQLTKKYKLHFWIYALVDRLEKGSEKPSEWESRFVKTGVADVRVLVKDGAENVNGILEAAGLKIYKSNDRMVYGHIEIDRLYALAELEEVKYVTP